jgi:heme-degrading monooxygenase HmoA
MDMMAYLYRWQIKAGKEKQFAENWATVTKAIREQCGSYGSRLHLANNGECVGYAQMA